MLKIGCILVLYNPDINLLHKVICSIENQIEKIYIIDNSSNNIDDSSILENNKIKLTVLKKNIGIAAAQNIGLKYFSEQNFDYIMFVDQDSILPLDLVGNLVNSSILLINNGYKVGVICPISINRQDGKPYKEKYPVYDSFSLNLSGKKYDFNKVNSCGSSASLISLENFRNVGFMDSRLFIDGVDNEWCWRAKDKCDLDSFILRNIGIDHQLGEGDASIFGIKVAISSPFRIYYQFRNYLLLCRRNYVPIEWKIKNGYKYFIKLFYFPLFISPRVKYLNNIFKGIKDGITFKE